MFPQSNENFRVGKPGRVYDSGALTWLNNSFENVNITLDPTYYRNNQTVNSDMRLVADNNLFKDGGWLLLEPFPTSAGNWTFENNLFDKIDFLQDTNQPLDFDYNGYWPMQASELLWGGDSGQLLPAAGGNLFGANEQVLSNAPPYQCGPFGKFYLPDTTPLYGAGSRSPADAGLYQYTTRLDQTKEGDETSGHMVNIGVHYVAANIYGQPFDTDGDGVPDYLEDANGNGIYDPATESDWRTPETNGVYFLGLTNGMVLSGVVSLPVEMYGVNTEEVADAAFYTDIQPLIGAAVSNNYDLWLNWRMNWDTRMVTNGTYTIYPEADFTTEDSAEGSPVSVTVSNEISFPNWMPEFGELGNSLLIRATSAHTNVDWTIDVYDSHHSYIGSFEGHTDGGDIQVIWDLVGPDGTIHTNDSFFTFEVTTPFSDPPTPPIYKVTDPWSGPGAWVAVAQHAWDGTIDSGTLYAELSGFIGWVLNANWTVIPPPQGQNDNGDWLAYGLSYGADNPQGNADWQAFRNALYDPRSRNLVYFGHGGANGIGSNPANANRYITATEIANNLHTIPAGQTNRHAFRFVFLDGCSTASGTLPEAFGIIHKEIFNLDDYTAASLRPSAFVGWTATKWITIVNGNYINYDHVNFISHVQLEMLLYGNGIHAAIHNAATDYRDVGWSFNWVNQMAVYGFYDLHFGQFNN